MFQCLRESRGALAVSGGGGGGGARPVDSNQQWAQEIDRSVWCVHLLVCGKLEIRQFWLRKCGHIGVAKETCHASAALCESEQHTWCRVRQSRSAHAKVAVWGRECVQAKQTSE
jgi:hypothetical protein